MRVTNIIKQAITDKVNAKCKEANKNLVLALNKEIDRIYKERDARKEELREKYKKLFMASLDKLKAKDIDYSYSYYSGDKCTDKEVIWERNCPGYSIDVSSKRSEELKAKITENENKAKKFINDIIVELELGAKKSDLEALLNSITF